MNGPTGKLPVFMCAECGMKMVRDAVTGCPRCGSPRVVRLPARDKRKDA